MALPAWQSSQAHPSLLQTSPTVVLDGWGWLQLGTQSRSPIRLPLPSIDEGVLLLLTNVFMDHRTGGSRSP